MKNIIPIIAISFIIIYAGVLLASPQRSMQSQDVKETSIQTQEPSLSILVPKETTPTQPTTSTSTSTPAKTTTTTPKPTTSTTPSTPKSPSYTMAQVATHNSSSSCWSVVNNKVYDLTSFINQHPGGSGAIKRLCVRDGTESFTDQHGGQRRPEQELASLQIGTLAL